MTVSYSNKVSTATFSCFIKLLMRWRGSMYKLLWREFFIFACAYYCLMFSYRFVMSETQKEYFETLASFCRHSSEMIPLAFLLGFYVNYVAGQWSQKFQTMPWPASTAMYLSVHLQGHDERARMMRRTIMRYICLAYVMMMAAISPPVKKRFPSWQHMVEAGFMTANEEKTLESIKTTYNKYFIPLVWAASLVTRARKEGRIKDDFAVNTLVCEINEFRARLVKLFNFDWVTIPLVYTQVVTVATYTFFVAALFARQFLDSQDNVARPQMVVMYLPIFTFLQFFFYMGWLKVAETMLNPFGEDDDDFDINYLIDRNLKIAYLIVDEMHAEHPELIKDQYWDMNQFDLPYTQASEQFKTTEPHIGSAADIEVPAQKQGFSGTSMTSLADIEERDENEPFMNSHRPSIQSLQHPILSRLMSTSSKSSHRQGLWKSMKRSMSRASRRGSVADVEMPEMHGPGRGKSHRKPKTGLPKNGSSFFSTDGVSLSPPSDFHEDIFRMSDSESDEGANESSAPLVHNANHTGGSKEKLHEPESSKHGADKLHPVGSVEKGRPIPASAADRGHNADKGHGKSFDRMHGGSWKGAHPVHRPHKDDGLPEVDTTLFPITEDPSPLAEATEDQQLSFLTSVRDQLKDLQTGNAGVQSSNAGLQSPSAEMEILSRLGSVRSQSDSSDKLYGASKQ